MVSETRPDPDRRRGGETERIGAGDHDHRDRVDERFLRGGPDDEPPRDEGAEAAEEKLAAAEESNPEDSEAQGSDDPAAPA